MRLNFTCILTENICHFSIFQWKTEFGSKCQITNFILDLIHLLMLTLAVMSHHLLRIDSESKFGRLIFIILFHLKEINSLISVPINVHVDFGYQQIVCNNIIIFRCVHFWSTAWIHKQKYMKTYYFFYGNDTIFFRLVVFMKFNCWTY